MKLIPHLYESIHLYRYLCVFVRVPSLACRSRYVLCVCVLSPSRSCVDDALLNVHILARDARRDTTPAGS